MPHHHTSPAHPEGPIVQDAVGYDQRIRGITFGHQRRFRKQMADLLQVREGEAILDVGCGTGDLAYEIARRVGSSGRAVGVDGSEAMIARARQKAIHRHLSIEFHVQMAETLSLPDQRFDGVVSSLLFHTLPGALKLQTLAAIAQLLKEGGRLLIIDFLDPSGFLLTHSAQSADQHDLPSLLRHAGFEPTQSGPFPFKTDGIPPLGYVFALN